MSASNPHGDQVQHERLCAYLFGELAGAERAAFEAELAASPELQEERARLEATIALVRDAVPAAEALSPQARAALSAAAAGKAGGHALAPIHAWPVRLVRSPYAAAAAVLALMAGAGALAFHQRRPAAQPLGESVARVENERADALAQAREGETFGFSEDGKREEAPSAAVAAEAAPAGGDKEVAEKAKEEVAQDLLSFQKKDAGDGRGPGDSPPPAEADQGVTEDLVGLGYLSPAEKLSAVVETAGGQPVDMTAGLDREAKDGLPHSEGATVPLSGGGEGNAAVPQAEGPTSPGAPIGVGTGGSRVAGRSAYTSRRAGGGSNPHGGKAVVGQGSAGPPTTSPAPARSLSETWFYSDPSQVPGDQGTLNDLLVAAGESKDRRGELGELMKDQPPASSDDDGGYRFAGGTSVGVGGGGGSYDRDAYCDELVRACRIRPRETPSMMFFRCWGDNPFEFAQLDPLSTFAADVDTASYALARGYLERGLMPTKAQIRTEEFINSFDSGVPAPTQDVFALDLELAPSLFGQDRWMLRVVLRGKEVDKAERPHLALTFVVDVSGSMQQENRLELVKHALRLLVGELDARDSIAIVAFSTEARLVLPLTSAGQRSLIESALYGLQPDGSTNAEAGLRMGYEVAGAGLTAGANNRVVLLSDGVANVGNTGEDAMLAGVAEQRAKGIYLNTIGVGMGNHNDALLEQLADKGDGICNYIDSPEEAKRVLVENFTGAFVPLARDVKLQVQFDPAQVQQYRLLGYENRALADAQFRDDKVDAGELGAGHQVTALYELVRSPASTGDGPLATARARFKPPFAVDAAKVDAESRAAAETAREIQRSIAFAQAASVPQAASPGFQKAVLVAQFAEFLRRSVHARGDSYDAFMGEALRVAQVAEDPEFKAFAQLAAGSRDLIVRNLPADDRICQALDELTKKYYLEGQLERLKQENHELTDELLEKLQKENAELEQRIKDLIKEQLEHSGR